MGRGRSYFVSLDMGEQEDNRMVATRILQFLRTTLLLMVLFVSNPLAQSQDGRPVANAGSSRYAGPDPIILDGSGSYDPDGSGTLSYTWRQISGPSVVIVEANTATPTIAGSMSLAGRDPTPKPQGFTQTDEIQICEFELVVSDGVLASLPDIVRMIIVADFDTNKLYQVNPPFDPERPTRVHFYGLGGCQNVGSDPSWFLGDPPVGWKALDEKANFITFSQFLSSPATIKQVGDMLIVYLSSNAPNYCKPIQIMGGSAGGEPAIDMGIYLNETYADRRYSINRVTLLDASGYCRDYKTSIERFLASAVDGEQCWIDNYSGTLPGSYGMKMDYGFKSNVLNVWFDAATGPGTTEYKHAIPGDFYGNSFIDLDLQDFNHGVIAGGYWSVIGPGKNLQLASTPDVEAYKFTWYGDASSGYMDFYDEPNHPGRLPELVTLVGPEDGAVVDANGAVFSCEVSENAVRYQLLFGSDPYRVMDYIVVSDTQSPPVEVIGEFPFEKTWWTVKAYDSFESTIHADPRYINAMIVSESLTPPNVLHIYNNDLETAESFRTLLVDYGCPTTLVKMADVPILSLNTYDMVIVANDTQYKSSWIDPNAVAAIGNSGKPVIGLGEGGYDFFGLLGLSIGSPNGGHGIQSSIEVVDPNSLLFHAPYSINIPEGRALQLYTDTNSIEIYLWPAIPETVTAFGNKVNDSGYYPLVAEHNRYLLWGFTESPKKMTRVGRRLFINVVIQTANRDWGS